MTLIKSIQKYLTLALAYLILTSTFVFGDAEMSPVLDEIMSQNVSSGSHINVVVFLEDSRINKAEFKASLNGLNRAGRIKEVTRRLSSARAFGSFQVEEFLSKYALGDIERFWIAPAVSMTIDISNLEELKNLPGVDLIVPDVALDLIAPVEDKTAPELSSAISDAQNLINIRSLWNLGYTGTGRLICSFDTGVESTHPALASKWRGNHASLSESWYSPVTPSNPPSDASGHGTHTMGIMVGSSGADTIGVAPGAEWICAGVIDQGRDLNTTLSDIIRAFQWALNPDGDTSTTDDVPDVINNSWGVPVGLLPQCSQYFWQMIDNVEAAGIVTIFAAGNEGPNPSTLRNPADRTSSPLNSFAVGAVDNSKVIAGFSSRGPSLCDASQKKPEVVAPGVMIRSATIGGGYKYMSGTSMAAPFISGLVALCRQYNPEATVEQIKNALILSADDLGVVGEDNAYGYGLVDASKLLDYLPLPSQVKMEVVGTTISGNGVAEPGEHVDLMLSLENSTANVDYVSARLEAINPEQITVNFSQSSFFFGEGGLLAINYEPFSFTVAPNLMNGTHAGFRLCLESSDVFYNDTIYFSLTIGYAPAGEMADHITGSLDFTVSTFGQFGMAPGSIYNVAGLGFRYNDSQNYLYEAGLIMGRNSLQLSSSIRDDSGHFAPSDFIPEEVGSQGWLNLGEERRYQTRYYDKYSDISIPISVRQETVQYTNSEYADFIIMRFFLVNTSLESLTDLSFGFLADFDLSAGGDRVVYDPATGLIYQEASGGPVVGIVNLKNISSYKALANGESKIGFDRHEKYDLIASGGIDVPEDSTADWLFMVGLDSVDINVFDSLEATFALVVGDDVADFYANAALARQKFDFITDVEEEMANLPDDFVLNQNYPNPFNPTTTISFTLAKADDMTLDIYNTLGQKVRTLYAGQLSAGSHEFIWNATDETGSPVATGVYFYRLSSKNLTETKKMLLLK